MINTKKDIWVEGFYSQWEIDNIDFTKPTNTYLAFTDKENKIICQDCYDKLK